MVTDKPKKPKGSGWRKISSPEDLQSSLVTMLNKILMSSDPLAHAGRFASLANTWLNAKRLELESGEWQEIKERLDLVEQAQAFDNPQEMQDLKENMAKLKEMMKVYEANC
jgi:hypothetical protein